MHVLSGWGQFPVVEGRERLSENLETITERAILTRGLGRSYGDASLPPTGGHTVAATRLADRILAFDPESGLLRAEAGLSLYRLNRALLARGWFTPVTPGTQFVTLGGMIAADVHGKNHHAAGSFGRHVSTIRLRVADGTILDVTRESQPELFRATLGGMGLTGHILEAEFRLESVPSPWIWSESEAVPDLETLVERLVEAGKSWPFTVAWADCLNRNSAGRGLVIKGRWADPAETSGAGLVWPDARLDVPFHAPEFLLNPASVRAFNAVYYRKHGRRIRTGIVHPEPFFYPLDAVHNWNRIYGRRGFTQYQCVIPHQAGMDAFRKLFRILDQHRAPSFLCVVKDFASEGEGLISFPRSGMTFTFDIPIRGVETERAVCALNDHVAAEGGRVYLAKDALSLASHIRAMDGRIDAFNTVRRRWDPRNLVRSAQSVRLFGDDE